VNSRYVDPKARSMNSRSRRDTDLGADRSVRRQKASGPTTPNAVYRQILIPEV